VELFLITLLNGLSYGLLLFMLASGLTLIFSMMGVLNFAHAGFYMLGAYLAHEIAGLAGFWTALLLAPLAVGLLGAAVERFALRHVHRHGHLAELLFTFGLSFVILEAVQLIWGRGPLTQQAQQLPELLRGSLFTLYTTTFPVYRAFMMAVAILMLLAIHLLLSRTRAGLVVRAALVNPAMAETLGHNVPRVMTLVFGGGCALAGLAGVIGGTAFVTEPGMAAALGNILFVVVVVGGLGSLQGALLASLAIGILQTWAVSLDLSLGGVLARAGWLPASADASTGNALLGITIAQTAPVLPYLLLVLMLLLRPRGLMGARQ
jgi:branched-chain amino acid transport system permease protein